MTTFKLLSAAVVLSAAIATPALAQEVIYNPGRCAQYYPNANCQNLGPNNPYTGSYQRGAWDNGWNNNSGFWPGDVAVSGAVGIAGAIAGAPFRGYRNDNSYAAMNGEASYCAQRYRSYDPASGTFLGRDGRRHVCQ